MKNKGFTLIELLVVISIISLLSTVVMASLNSARTKAQEAAIKTDLNSIKTQAELSYNKVGDYSGVSIEIVPILAHINNNGGTAAFYTYNNVHYAVSVKLKSDNAKNWSVSDQSGIVIWDTENKSLGLVWIQAKNDCVAAGGRLPTVEELKALFDAYGALPPNFVNYYYWSDTVSLTDPDNKALSVQSGVVYEEDKTYGRPVRCVR